jgi:hypothetical protein
MMIVDKEHALDDHIIHLTEDNITCLKVEFLSVRGALLAKFPDASFQHILPNLDPERIIPEDAEFENVIGPNPDTSIYGDYGWTVRADRIPYCIFLAKFVGIQMDVETPFIEEFLMWVQKINNNEDVPCRNSQWRHEYFQKRQDLIKKNSSIVLQKEVMDMLMATEHCKDGALLEEAGIFDFCTALIERQWLEYDEWLPSTKDDETT